MRLPWKKWVVQEASPVLVVYYDEDGRQRKTTRMSGCRFQEPSAFCLTLAKIAMYLKKPQWATAVLNSWLLGSPVIGFGSEDDPWEEQGRWEVFGDYEEGWDVCPTVTRLGLEESDEDS